MNTSRLILSFALILMAGAAGAQSPSDIGRGNMHFEAKDMDVNGDGMVSKDEMQKYSAKMWEQMAGKDHRTLPVQQAAQDFSRGNLRFDANEMDSDADGQISKDEFMHYSDMKFEAMKKDSKNRISVADAARDIGRGNMHLDEKSSQQ